MEVSLPAQTIKIENTIEIEEKKEKKTESLWRMSSTVWEKEHPFHGESILTPALGYFPGLLK